MTAAYAPALADLARALEVLEGWSITWTSKDGNSIVATCKADEDQDPVADLMIFANGSVESSCETFFLPIVWAGIDAIRAWQAPPRPDAAAFEQAVTAYGDAAVDFGYYSEGDKQEDACNRMNTARAALLAFAPSADAATITEGTLTRDDLALVAEAFACGIKQQCDPAKVTAMFQVMRRIELAANRSALNGGAHD